MKEKKLLFLFLALLLPVVIFLFLKSFGENEFDVPVLHMDGVIAVPAGCDFNYTTPYRVADSLMSGLELNDSDSLYVLYFDAPPAAMSRLSYEFEDDPLQLVAMARMRGNIDQQFFRDCALLMPAEASVALVDHRYRIRGYYDGRDRDEVDRLMVEIKIILKQY